MAPVGTQESSELHASAVGLPGVTAAAFDETVVVPAANTSPVQVLPAHSGVVAPGGTVAYTHRLVNSSGASDTFYLWSSNSGAGCLSRHSATVMSTSSAAE